MIGQRAGDAPFDAPWQARVFAMAMVAAERAGVDWDEFRDRLKAAVAADPERPYYETWMEALEAFAAELAPRPA